ncbi:O-methyltransferase-domain-containing protein [Hypoxylon crocopeplum]|nr:O-methyltransferase-domain-containing protein [Hypoxylon crocopeplum]
MTTSVETGRGDSPSIIALAEQISSLCSQVSSYLMANSFPQPSFKADVGVVPQTPDYEALRAPLNDAVLDLLRLVNGPKASLLDMCFSHYNLAAMQIALDRGFPHYVPVASATGSHVGKGATVAEIAQKAGMDADRTGRILKLLATQRIFEEVVDDPNTECHDESNRRFTHTASSALLARDAPFYAALHLQVDDNFRAASESSAQISLAPFASSATDCPFSKAYGSSMYQYMAQRPEKAERFAKAMVGWAEGELRQMHELHSGYPWESLEDGTVVDIGGGNGHISVGLARKVPTLNFIVQDISLPMLSAGKENQNDGHDHDVYKRLNFQHYDFFQPQPVRDASAFLMRQVLHNYNDKESIKVIRAVIPAMERCAAPLLINDIIIPKTGTIPRFQEEQLRKIDINMMVVLGAKQRSREEWARLIKEADERLEVVRVVESVSGGLGLIEVRLRVQ